MYKRQLLLRLLFRELVNVAVVVVQEPYLIQITVEMIVIMYFFWLVQKEIDILSLLIVLMLDGKNVKTVQSDLLLLI